MRGREDLLTIDEAARYLRTTTRRLKNLRMRGQGPRAVKLTRLDVLFKVSDLDEWVEACLEERGPGWDSKKEKVQNAGMKSGTTVDKESRSALEKETRKRLLQLVGRSE